MADNSCQLMLQQYSDLSSFDGEDGVLSRTRLSVAYCFSFLQCVRVLFMLCLQLIRRRMPRHEISESSVLTTYYSTVDESHTAWASAIPSSFARPSFPIHPESQGVL